MKRLLVFLLLLNPSFTASSDRFEGWGLLDVHAPEAWSIEEGSNSIVVAVVDTGLDSNHPDVSSNVWHDGRTGYYGWDFISNSPNPNDQHGHGTHVAGIIGSSVNASSGTGGVAKHVSIMSLRYYSEYNSGVTNLRNAIKSINWAVDHGARIINYSGGGPEFSEEEYDAVRRAEAKGVLIVAAAGNERRDTDVPDNRYYPASYHLSNVISVAAIDPDGHLIRSSSWGSRSVDLAAPGDHIYSTLPGRRYGVMSGTSQATAFVTGAAALLLSKDPKLTPSEIKEILVSSCSPVSSLRGVVRSAGKLDVNAALKLLLKTKRAKSRSSLVPRGFIQVKDPV